MATYSIRDRAGRPGGGKGPLVVEELSQPLMTSNNQTIVGDYIARRLTPRDCERLQGFPEDWTKVPYKGKPAEDCPDGPRYKALGNSFAVPVIRWIGERIEMMEEIDEQQD